jgi:hypothetical protein
VNASNLRHTLDQNREKAVEAFRHERLAEPTDLYHEVLDDARATFETLLELTIDFTLLSDASVRDQVFTDVSLFEALRYVAGPYISADDLALMAEVPRVPISKTRLSRDAPSVVDTIRDFHDRERFPFIADNREATSDERAHAVFASAVLLASSRIRTARRQLESAKSAQIAAGLERLGYSEAQRQDIETWSDLPPVGSYYRNARVRDPHSARTNRGLADYAVRLSGGEVWALYFQASNSEVNSIKRLTKEAVPVAQSWRGLLTGGTVSTAAVLSGVFSLNDLESAQADGLHIHWIHDLEPLMAQLTP